MRSLTVTSAQTLFKIAYNPQPAPVPGGRGRAPMPGGVPSAGSPAADIQQEQLEDPAPASMQDAWNQFRKDKGKSKSHWQPFIDSLTPQQQAQLSQEFPTWNMPKNNRERMQQALDTSYIPQNLDENIAAQPIAPQHVVTPPQPAPSVDTDSDGVPDTPQSVQQQSPAPENRPDWEAWVDSLPGGKDDPAIGTQDLQDAAAYETGATPLFERRVNKSDTAEDGELPPVDPNSPEALGMQPTAPTPPPTPAPQLPAGEMPALPEVSDAEKARQIQQQIGDLQRQLQQLSVTPAAQTPGVARPTQPTGRGFGQEVGNKVRGLGQGLRNLWRAPGEMASGAWDAVRGNEPGTTRRMRPGARALEWASENFFNDQGDPWKRKNMLTPAASSAFHVVTSYNGNDIIEATAPAMSAPTTPAATSAPVTMTNQQRQQLDQLARRRRTQRSRPYGGRDISDEVADLADAAGAAAAGAAAQGVNVLNREINENAIQRKKPARKPLTAASSSAHNFVK